MVVARVSIKFFTKEMPCELAFSMRPSSCKIVIKKNHLQI